VSHVPPPAVSHRQQAAEKRDEAFEVIVPCLPYTDTCTDGSRREDTSVHLKMADAHRTHTDGQ
jgi:hypothetical protein